MVLFPLELAECDTKTNFHDETRSVPCDSINFWNQTFEQ